MAPIHDGLGWKEFTYPYLGPDTGIFNANAPAETPNIIGENGVQFGESIWDNGDGISISTPVPEIYNPPEVYTPPETYTPPEENYYIPPDPFNPGVPDDGDATIIFG